MTDTRLIPIDGITGSSRSTAAQYIGWLFDLGCLAAKPHHEETPGLPLSARRDCEHLHGQAQETSSTRCGQRDERRHLRQLQAQLPGSPKNADLRGWAKTCMK